MFFIIWHHVKGCWQDLRSSRSGTLEVYERRGHTGQLFVGDGRREWRIR